MTPMLRRLAALGAVLVFAAAFAVGAVRQHDASSSSSTDLSGSASLASLAIGVTGLIAHRRRRSR